MTAIFVHFTAWLAIHLTVPLRRLDNEDMLPEEEYLKEWEALKPTLKGKTRAQKKNIRRKLKVKFGLKPPLITPGKKNRIRYRFHMGRIFAEAKTLKDFRKILDDFNSETIAMAQRWNVPIKEFTDEPLDV